MIQIDHPGREELGRKITETSQVCREGYKRNISQFNSDAENDAAEKCSIAASNTGWFILGALGFSDDEKRKLADEYRCAVLNEKTPAQP